MRVVYFANGSIPSRTANSVHIMKMCEALALEGHQVDLHVPDQGHPDLRNTDAFEWYGVRPVFRVRKAWWMPQHPQGFLDLVWVILTAIRLRMNRPEVCLTRNPWAGLIFPVFGIRTILELHAPVATQGRLGTLYRRFQAVRHPRLVKMVLISKALHRLYADQGFPVDKIQVLPDAVDIENYPEPAYSTRTSQLAIGYIGSLHTGKGMEILTRLAALDHGNTYHVFGGSPEDVTRWRTAPQTPGNVTFHGHVSHAEVPAVLTTFDVALMPYQRRVSVSGNYGDVAAWMSPLKMFESMASGRAILSSDLPVLREVLDPGRTALLADPDDAQAWRACIGQLSDPALRERLGRAAREEVLRLYSWQRRAKLILAPVLSKSP
jgi:glycosyltransferase involved in cell wall biosynthesis